MPKLRPALARSVISTRRIGQGDSQLTPLVSFGDNPGALKMLAFVPPEPAVRGPLVVVLHGCTQTAAGYDAAAGWTTLAREHGFALLFPEQVRSNNANTCFNWFELGDTARGGGEPASIVAAVSAMVGQHDLDPARVFVTGLSAGGAMAATLLAIYPDVFAGGAVIAGLPYGSAAGVNAAFGAMNAPPVNAARALGDKVRAASSFTGPWPRVMIWHGDADRTVAPANGDAVAAQWCDVHGLAAAPRISANGRESIERWADAGGVVQVELHRIAGMGHGTPIAARRDGMHAAPFMLDVGIPSSARIGAFWGIMPAVAAATVRSVPKADLPPRPPAPKRAASAEPRRGSVGETINAALRAAGLLH